MNRARLKGALRRALYRAGFEVQRHPRNHSNAGLLQMLIAAREVDTVADVGANDGGFGRDVRAIGFAGPIVSFEPVEESFARLESEARRLPPWSVHRLALGREPGSHVLHVSPEAENSSLLPPGDAYADMVLDDTTTTERTVEVSTLDAASEQDPALSGARSLLLKTDTQGYDLEVLAGGQRTLERVAVLQCELALRPLYEGAPDWLTALSEIERLGFALAGIYPVGLDRRHRLIDVDAVFVRSA